LIALDGGPVELLVGKLVSVGQDGHLGGHAVLQGVEPGFFFSGVGFRAGGLLGVPAICFDLFLCCHLTSKLQAGLAENAGLIF
jgi:hypothetical protein